MSRRQRSSIGRTSGLVGVTLVLVLLAAACGGSDDSGSGRTDDTDGEASAGATTTAPTAEAQDFSGPGPYEVGVVDLQLADRTVAVFYPAADVPDDAVGYSYSGAELFGPELAAALPGAFGADQPVDAFVEVPASDEGPFPVVLHSHGAGSYFRFSGRHNAQMASWGFVVAAVDHKERNLLAAFTGGGGGGDAEPDRDVEDLGAALDLLEAASSDAESVLEGQIDAERVALEGHSAGGGAVGLFAYDDRVDTWIGLAPVPPIPAEALPEGFESYEDFDFEAFYADTEPPDKPSMIIAADGDVAIPLAQVEDEFDWLPVPKRLVVLDRAGHNAFTDICAPIQQEGGLQATIDALGLGGNEAVARFVELGEDGCTDANPPAEDGFALFDHVTVAQLRWVFELDEPVAAASLTEDYLTATFPDLIESYRVDE